MWKLCNSMKHNLDQSRQVHALTRSLTRVLNEMGYIDNNGELISHTFKVLPVIQQREYRDYAIFVCWYIHTLVKFEMMEFLQGGKKYVYVEEFNKRRVKLAFRILNATDEWKHQKGTTFGQLVIYSQ
ncbi:hypothetical protein MKX03_018009, partial [Papaver bracteatum]